MLAWFKWMYQLSDVIQIKLVSVVSLQIMDYNYAFI